MNMVLLANVTAPGIYNKILSQAITYVPTL